MNQQYVEGFASEHITIGIVQSPGTKIVKMAIII